VSVADHPHVVPIGLLEGCTIVREVAEGEFVTIEDVRLDPTLEGQLDGHVVAGVVR
jgi:predicted homoserine dehydrogenase-like protein